MLAFFCMLICCSFISTTLSVSFDCPQCRPTSCRPLPVNCRHTYTDKCGCCSYCTNGLGQRCGGVLNYWGTCRPGLKCVYRLGGVFNEERHGFCERDFCSGQSCDYRKRCVDRTGQDRAFLCKCHPYDCTTINRTEEITVCGNNGVTYSNMCWFYKAECHHGDVIGIRNNGPCNSHQETIDTNRYRQLNVSLSYRPNSCLYQKQVYLVGDVISNEDPCTVMTCVENGTVLSIAVPSCGGNDVDLL